MLERYYIEKEKQEKLLSRKNVKSDFCLLYTSDAADD